MLVPWFTAYCWICDRCEFVSGLPRLALFDLLNSALRVGNDQNELNPSAMPAVLGRGQSNNLIQNFYFGIPGKGEYTPDRLVPKPIFAGQDASGATNNQVVYSSLYGTTVRIPASQVVEVKDQIQPSPSRRPQTTSMFVIWGRI